jgi:Zn finger protein HypA/HybF involved in hydrogenase expression
MSELDENKYTSRCPICDSPLHLDEDTGYRCPNCGWDASFELDDEEEWIIPDDQGD